MTPRPLLSIVCPVYQEENALPHFHRELLKVIDQLGHAYDFEILYADDGSRDGTLPLLRRMAFEDPRVHYLSLSRNFGQQAALTAGLAHASGDLVIMMDSDLQHPPEVIPLLLQQWQAGAEVVITIRAEDPGIGWFKRFSSRAFYRVMRLLSRTEIRSAASDFRLMTRCAVQGLLQMGETQRFIRGMVQWLGFPTAEVEFMPRQRVAGRSKYTFRSMLKLALDGMFSFSRVPLQLTGFFGFLLLVIASICGGTWLWQMVGGGATDGRFWLLMASMNLIGGCMLLGLGIVGEYVGRIYEQVKCRPVYVVKETSRRGQDPAMQAPRRAA